MGSTFMGAVRGGLAGLNEAAGNPGVASELEAANDRARQQKQDELKAKILPHGLAIKGLQQKLQTIDPQKNPAEYNATVDEIQQNVHAMREILHPDAKLGAGDWLKTHTTDRLHITSHDQRVRDLAAKNAAGVQQDEESAQAIAKGGLPYTKTPDFLAKQALEQQRIEGQIEVARQKGGSLKLYRLPNGGTAYLDPRHDDIPEGALPVSLASTTGKQVQISGPDGKPMFAMERDGKYYDQDGNLIPNARPNVHTSLQPKVGTSGGKNVFALLTDKGWVDAGTREPLADFRPLSTFAQQGLYGIDMMQMPDGTIGSALLNRRTGQFKPITSQSGVPIAPQVFAQVSKNLEPALESDTRFRVMKDSEPEALAGNQQAMLNIVANHIGMTLGLQKGTRISQAMWNEAIATAPWLKRVEAKFDEHGYLSGVTLTPQQIRQMVSLGEDRRRRQWQQAQEAGAEYGVNVPIPEDLDSPSSTLEGPKTRALRQVRARTAGGLITMKLPDGRTGKIHPSQKDRFIKDNPGSVEVKNAK